MLKEENELSSAWRKNLFDEMDKTPGRIQSLKQKGYKEEDLNVLDKSEFDFIYNFEEYSEIKFVSTSKNQKIMWNGNNHLKLIMRMFSDLPFVRMENDNGNYIEYYIFPIIEYKSKNYKIDKTPKIIIKKIKKQCDLFLTGDFIPMKFSEYFDKVDKYKGKSKWHWNGNFSIEEDVKNLKKIIMFLIENPNYVGDFNGIF
jgi:hypothetical protein